MKLQKFLFASITAITFFSCAQEKQTTIAITNTLDFSRNTEVISLSKEKLRVSDLNSIGIKDVESGELQVTQLVDVDGDAVMDEILFQPSVNANTTKKFAIVTITEAEKPKALELCYSRFVPERTDDYTWENNKVAFRMYGPLAQKMIEDKIKGGTLSSGVDAWLKRVETPVINKWYKGNDTEKGYYHKDHGEGLDNFHVGVSRGVGGIAIKEDGEYFTSKNYTKWRTITTGPLRTSFYLEHATWKAGKKTITESKVITLDLNNFFTKFDIAITGTSIISAGLTLHEKDGKTTGNKENGWVSYWQPHADSELGTAIIADTATFNNFEEYNVEAKDKSNAYAHLNVTNNNVVYYAGFGWKKQGEFTNSKDWEAHLNKISKQVNNPLKVKVSI